MLRKWGQKVAESGFSVNLINYLSLINRQGSFAMTRLKRLDLPGLLSTSSNGGITTRYDFFEDQGFSSAKEWLEEYSKKFGMDIHAYVLMTNHVHILATPQHQEAYRALFTAHVNETLINDIRTSVNKGLVFGSERFKDEIETNLKRRVRPAKMGRPKRDAEDRLKQKSLL